MAQALMIILNVRRDSPNSLSPFHRLRKTVMKINRRKLTSHWSSNSRAIALLTLTSDTRVHELVDLSHHISHRSINNMQPCQQVIQ